MPSPSYGVSCSKPPRPSHRHRHHLQTPQQPINRLQTFSAPSKRVFESLRSLPSLQHLLQLHPHDFATSHRLQHRQDLGQALVPHLLQVAQQAGLEEHLDVDQSKQRDLLMRLGLYHLHYIFYSKYIFFNGDWTALI